MRAVVLLNFALIIFLQSIIVGASAYKKRFQLYWNLPSYNCRHAIAPEKHGILTNENQSFYGENIVIFYEHKLGLYPKIINDKENYSKIIETINGGLPQNVNLTAHLQKVKEDVSSAIPNKNFSGLAIIDYEDWRPLYDSNWSAKSIYKKESVIEVKKKYPNISKKAIELKAQELFDTGAKKFLLETIKLCKKLRPKAKWGFYDFPMCNYDAGREGELECSKNYQRINERLLWLYREVGAFYPQIYLYKMSEDRETTQRYIHSNMMEADWIQFRSKRYIPTYFYSKIEYSPYDNRSQEEHFYTKEDLCDTIGYPINMGASGIIFWSTSKDMKQRCQSMKDYFDDQFGSYLKHFSKKIARCEKKLCNNHGRCVLEDRMPKVGCFPNQSRYYCECDKGYIGPNCKTNDTPNEEDE